MNIQDLIDKLNTYEDKTIPVCIIDIAEAYMPPEELTSMEMRNDSYTDLLTLKDGKFLCLGAGQ